MRVLTFLFLVGASACHAESVSANMDAQWDADAAPTPGTRVLEIDVPGSDVNGFTVYQPDELRDDPRAGRPSYIFLDYGLDAVELAGPGFPLAASSVDEVFTVGEVTVEPYQWGGEIWEDGLAINVTGLLRFEIKMEDFENEINPLGRVTLRHESGFVRPSITMLGNGSDGVAHKLVITALLNGEPVGAVPAGTIEMRGNP